MKQKLIGTFVGLALLVVAACGFAYYSIRIVDTSYTDLIEGHVETAQVASVTLGLAEQQHKLLLAYLLEPNKELEQKLAEVNGRLTGNIKELEKLVSEVELEQVTEMERSNETFARLVQKVQDYVQAGRTDLALTEARMWTVPLTETMVGAANELQRISQEAMEKQQLTNSELVSSAQRTFLGVSAVAVVVALLLGWLLSRMILLPIVAMVRLAGQIADCDLTVKDLPVKTKDELGQLAKALNGMKANLRNVIEHADRSAGMVASSAEQLSASSEEFSKASTHIADSSQKIAAGTVSQVDRVELTVAALQQVSENLLAIADKAVVTSRKSLDAKEEAVTGDQTASRAAVQMGTVSERMDGIAQAVLRLSERSAEIEKANSLIGQIAKQTNILSINASIEAARAGSEGRGFAVVASQIRQLSGVTAQAAEQVFNLMEEMRKDMNEVKASTVEGQAEVKAGLEVMELTSQSLERIRTSSEEASKLVGEVEAQTGEMTVLAESALLGVRTIQGIAHEAAMSAGEVSAGTQEQVAGMEEIAAASAALLQMAEELRVIIGRFQMRE